ncbi:type VI immunity family protein [Vitiosangium sp. GDMCC 1.1324]|uniref:type VI immunity family protein n=1 Tax=Vitiosangium sp. (strain GDMCC 1.1324) TaxID=2138576 RepID=UPI001E312345|nr:type VI immunity family protein [Vitiosangium sp. GDMCC 1.1324]
MGVPPVDSAHGEELLAREVIRLAFYLPYDHPDIAASVGLALDSYMQAVGEGPETIDEAFIDDDEGAPLSPERWSAIRQRLRPERHWRFADDYTEVYANRVEKRRYETQIFLNGGNARNGFSFRYRARIPWRTPAQNKVSVLAATVPTEYLESHGPARVVELARTMASQLQFTTGHAGLSLQLYWPLRSTDGSLRTAAFRYPGIDLRPAWLWEEDVGFHVDGAHWLNFFAPPVLEKLGGTHGLRERLRSKDTTVEELDGDRVVVALGEWPESGDLQQGLTLPAYRELAHALGPLLEPLTRSSPVTWMAAGNSFMGFTEEEALGWWRRFRD